MRQSASVLAVARHLIFLEADLDTRVARADARSHDASDADAAVARMQASHDLGTLDWTRIDASGTPEETLARARTAIKL
jgi:predicted kinase